MNKKQSIFAFLLRIALGWLFFYAGITKVLNPEWTAGGFLKGAKTMTGLYSWFANDSMLPLINFVNEWGLTLLGVSLILGAFIRVSAPLGVLLMLLYYFPRLQGFMPDANSFIVDQHIIFAFALLLLASLRAGHYWGLDKRLSQIPALRKISS